MYGAVASRGLYPAQKDSNLSQTLPRLDYSERHQSQNASLFPANVKGIPDRFNVGLPVLGDVLPDSLFLLRSGHHLGELLIFVPIPLLDIPIKP